jgi:hypothetical protein
MIKIDFDVDSIVTIFFRSKREDTQYEWVPEKEVSTFKTFLLIFSKKSGKKIIESHWTDTHSWHDTKYTTEQMKAASNYIIDEDNHICYEKPYVKVSLKHERSLEKKFITDEEALEWISSLKIKSGKNFETITS